jgi:SAM-dependent methyltransferase
MARREAEQGFVDGAEFYRRARPAYPEAAVTALIERLGLAPGHHVVELGAGTGIFSRQLAERGVLVSAVEPVAAMRSATADVPGVTFHDRLAEQTGLPDGCADAVVAATAWHWFDAPAAIREVRRLLAPGAGGLGLIWNGYDESVPWVAEYAGIADLRRASTTPSARSGRWREFFTDLDGWEPLAEDSFPNPWPTSARGLMDRLLSSSAITQLPASEREQARAEVENILCEQGLTGDDEFTLPYETSIFWTKPTRG